MRRVRLIYTGVLLASLVVSVVAWSPAVEQAATAGAQQVGPEFRVDPTWPRPLPNNWLVGQVAGVAVDTQDSIWIVQRPSTLTADERGLETGRSMCCLPAPPVMQFDTAGNVLQAWGGPASCAPPEGVTPVVGGSCYEWPPNEHGIFVDYKGNVWIGGNGTNDHQVLKFSRDGTFLLQIGRAGVTGGDDDTRHLGQPADIFVDPAANEVYIADGYRNHRVIVFDADTGAYKRHWGAYGLGSAAKAVERDPTAAEQFSNPVHCVVIGNDELLYVCDRVNNRVQVFSKAGLFVREFFIRRETLGNGATWDVDFSPDRLQTHLYNADGENNVVWVLLRESGTILNTFGRHGRNAGQFHWVHNLAVDSRGNIYTAEVDTGKRAQKFTPAGS